MTIPSLDFSLLTHKSIIICIKREINQGKHYSVKIFWGSESITLYTESEMKRSEVIRSILTMLANKIESYPHPYQTYRH